MLFIYLYLFIFRINTNLEMSRFGSKMVIKYGLDYTHRLFACIDQLPSIYEGYGRDLFPYNYELEHLFGNVTGLVGRAWDDFFSIYIPRLAKGIVDGLGMNELQIIYKEVELEWLKVIILMAMTPPPYWTNCGLLCLCQRKKMEELNKQK